MKPTETPAYRPTAGSIWNSFLISGKRHLILTGSRGSGKTTRINALRKDLPGIRTCAIVQSSVYMESYPSGEKVQIGIFDPSLPGIQNRMRPLITELDDRAASMLRKLASSMNERVFIDEIGYLETASTACMDALRNLFDQKKVIAAVRKQDVPFLMELRQRPDAFCVDLDDPFGNTGCVIMASGQSKRFGSNKLLADFHGSPMISRILDAAESIFARLVVVTRHPEIAALCSERGIDAILHDQPFRSDTARLGLDAIGDVDQCMFCPADQPLLQKDTISSLILCAVHEPACIWRPCFGDEPGSPVLFPKWTFDALRHLPEGKGGGYVARMHPEHVRTLPVQNPYELMDADDPQALQQLLRFSIEP